jgi:hypothetical protein
MHSATHIVVFLLLPDIVLVLVEARVVIVVLIVLVVEFRGRLVRASAKWLSHQIPQGGIPCYFARKGMWQTAHPYQNGVAMLVFLLLVVVLVLIVVIGVLIRQ